jgi:hypothetical protein
MGSLRLMLFGGFICDDRNPVDVMVLMGESAHVEYLLDVRVGWIPRGQPIGDGEEITTKWRSAWLSTPTATS